jgi:hypothetical protein
MESNQSLALPASKSVSPSPIEEIIARSDSQHSFLRIDDVDEQQPMISSMPSFNDEVGGESVTLPKIR